MVSDSHMCPHARPLACARFRIFDTPVYTLNTCAYTFNTHTYALDIPTRTPLTCVTCAHMTLTCMLQHPHVRHSETEGYFLVATLNADHQGPCVKRK